MTNGSSAVGPIVRADMSGDDTITLNGETIRHRTPILHACRVLLAKGHPPDTELRCFRGAMPCMTVTHIGRAAEKTLWEDGTSPTGYRVVPYRPFPGDVPRAGRPRMSEAKAPGTQVA